MELRRLKYFLAVAEELHFGRAAVRLKIAQPPLSRQISALEAEIGAQLFDRSRSQIRLTQAGTVLESHARFLIDRLDAVYRETRLVGEGGAGRLRVAFVGSASHGVLPTLIKSYRSHFPNVELALSAMNNAELHRALIQREIDVAVARPELRDEELRRELLAREKLVLAIPDNSELAGFSEIRFAELSNQTFVLYPRRPRPSYADVVLDICRKEGFEPAALELAHPRSQSHAYATPTRTTRRGRITRAIRAAARCWNCARRSRRSARRLRGNRSRASPSKSFRVSRRACAMIFTTSFEPS